MPDYFEPTRYIKDESWDPIYRPVNKRFLAKSRIYPAVLVSLGLFVLITQVVIPLVSFETLDDVSKPVANTLLGKVSGYSDFNFTELKGSTPYIAYDEKNAHKGDVISPLSKTPTQVLGASDTKVNIPKTFYLSIPKLKIKNAVVETNSPSLNPDKSLGHYAGTSLPGDVGNAFIYGHSVLPWFFNPRNYKTIFSTLDTLKVGDEIAVTYNNKTYEYKVERMLTKSPEEVDPLAEFKPRYLNESTITLMTCVPPGTRLKRLLVQAVMVN